MRPSLPRACVCVCVCVCERLALFGALLALSGAFVFVAVVDHTISDSFALSLFLSLSPGACKTLVRGVFGARSPIHNRSRSIGGCCWTRMGVIPGLG